MALIGFLTMMRSRLTEAAAMCFRQALNEKQNYMNKKIETILKKC